MSDLNIEKEYKQVQADLKNVSDDLKAYAEKSQKEISNHAALSAETKQSVDKLLTTQGELNARLQSAEQLMAKLDSGDRSHGRIKTMGEQFITADGFEQFAISAAGGKKGSFSHGVKATVTSTIALSNGSSQSANSRISLRLPTATDHELWIIINALRAIWILSPAIAITDAALAARPKTFTVISP